MVLSYHILLVTSSFPLGIALETIVCQVYSMARISTVTTGLDALAVADQSMVDLVISTPDTGIIDGLELTRILRTRSDTLPIILISRDCTLETEANEAGVTLFLDSSELVNRLKMALPELLEPPHQS